MVLITIAVLEEETLTDELLLNTVKEVYANRQQYIDAMSASGQMDPIGTIIKLIEENTK